MILKPRPFRKLKKGHWATKNLVGFWPFYEGDGDVVLDLSGNGYHGIEQQDSVWQPGKFGPCRYFSGDDVIDLGTLPTGTGQDRILVVWAAADDWSDTVNNCIFHSVDFGISCYTYNTGGVDYIAWRTNSDDKHLMSLAGISDGTLHQLVCVVNSSDVITDIYLDGIAQAHGAAVGYGFITGNQIGGRGNVTGYDDWFKGKIDHVGIMKGHGFTASKIAKLYREPFCMFERDPIELWSAATLGAAPPVGMAGAMTTNTGVWGW